MPSEAECEWKSATRASVFWETVNAAAAAAAAPSHGARCDRGVCVLLRGLFFSEQEVVVVLVVVGKLLQ